MMSSIRRSHGRAVLLWRCGALRFRYLYRKSYIRKSDRSCPNNLCGEDDTYAHAVRCPFALIKMSRDENVMFEDRLAQFLINLNKDRIKRHGLAIL